MTTITIRSVDPQVQRAQIFANPVFLARRNSCADRHVPHQQRHELGASAPSAIAADASGGLFSQHSELTMNKASPSLQAAVVTGLNILNDPEVRVPASQADGVSALRALLQGLASGQLIVAEAPTAQTPQPPAPPMKKPRAPRRTKAQMAAAMNGATPPAAAPPSVQ
jgi:hypothetical protein